MAWVINSKCWGYLDGWAADDDVQASMAKLKAHLEAQGIEVIVDEAKNLRAMRIENFSRNQQVMRQLREGGIDEQRVKRTAPGGGR